MIQYNFFFRIYLAKKHASRKRTTRTAKSSNGSPMENGDRTRKERRDRLSVFTLPYLPGRPRKDASV